jgi:hypothetical protein
MWRNLFIVATQLAIKEQLKDLTYMLSFRISHYKLYKKDIFSYVFTIKYMCNFEMSLEKCNPKGTT